jgi:hypothetical protein
MTSISDAKLIEHLLKAEEVMEGFPCSLAFILSDIFK